MNRINMNRLIWSVDEKRKFINKNGGKCVYCSCASRFVLNIDHKTPLTRGGLDIEKNKQVTCIICNHLKVDMTHMEFKKYLKILNELRDFNKIKVPIFNVPIILTPTALIKPELPHGIVRINKKIMESRK